MSDLETLLKTTPESLADLQHKELQAHVLRVLSTISHLIESGNYDEISQFLGFSPAGDGYGCDNHFINFSYESDDSSVLDIRDVCDKLSLLKKQSKLR